MAAGSWFGAAALLDLYPIVASGQRQHPLSCSPQRSKRGGQPKIARFGDPCQNHGSKSQSWLVPDAEGADQAWWAGARREGARKHMIGRQQHGVQWSGRYDTNFLPPSSHSGTGARLKPARQHVMEGAWMEWDRDRDREFAMHWVARRHCSQHIYHGSCKVQALLSLLSLLDINRLLSWHIRTSRQTPDLEAVRPRPIQKGGLEAHVIMTE